MFAAVKRSLQESGQPAAAAAVVVATTFWSDRCRHRDGITRMEASKKNETLSSKTRSKDNQKEPLFHGQCLQRQLFQPKVPYPAWDFNWDGRQPQQSSSAKKSKGVKVKNTPSKTTRHIILVRHGQYDETSKIDTERKLTPLGRLQAERTGIRLASILKGSNLFPEETMNGPCEISKIYVSDMTRAKETADIIAKQLQHVRRNLRVEPPDPRLNEALPAPMIPPRQDIKGAVQEIDENHERIEEAFQSYFYRSEGQSKSVDDNTSDGDEEDDDGSVRDEFEVIVCHGNVIRYFFCRALQLPPEAWLRMSIFNCSLTYLIIRPDGYVSARSLGDVGHLPYDESTFSNHYGFKW